MTREEAIELAIDEHDCKYSEELMNRIYHDFEVQLKAKDERIKELDCRAYHAEGYISDLHNEYPKHKKFLDTKARSIVAMLFWEWRKAERLCKIYQDHATAREERRFYAKQSFYKAYKMLKDSK